MLTPAERATVLRIAHLHGAARVRVFGSVARGTAGKDSDLDLLVDMGPGTSLLNVIAIKQDLEELLGRKVDVLTESAISRYFRDDVLKEAEPL